MACTTMSVPCLCGSLGWTSHDVCLVSTSLSDTILAEICCQYNWDTDKREANFPVVGCTDCYNTIPSDGWSAHTGYSSDGLEWLWAAPCAPSQEYYDAFPNHVQSNTCPYNKNFPDCIRYSGFRLPTLEELEHRPQRDDVPCMATYGNSNYTHCNLPHYDGPCSQNPGPDDPDCIASQTLVTGSMESVYVRDIETAVDSCINLPPTALCQEAVAEKGAAFDIDAGSFDYQGGFPVTLEQDFDSFLDPGVKHVTLTVTDSEGKSSTCSALVVIYDPSAGFVTGGGWIDSPLGAYKLDESPTGKANFGFVSKYKKGATVPTGETEFVFEAGAFLFESNTYEWLVVNQGGTNAQFKGEGLANGELRKFMLWATDGDPEDTFRIRIWFEDDTTGDEVDIYDNGIDGLNQVLGGGSIKIHTKGKRLRG